MLWFKKTPDKELIDEVRALTSELDAKLQQLSKRGFYVRVYNELGTNLGFFHGVHVKITKTEEY